MDLKNWYDRVREQLSRLDFPALWAGFAPCPFALYTHDTAILNGEVMPRPAEFYGNTSVCRQGEHLAIWNMEADPPADVAGLAASLVHEMFHSFQFRCGEQGWPDDLVLAAAKPQPAFLALRAQEHRALAGGAPPARARCSCARRARNAGCGFAAASTRSSGQPCSPQRNWKLWNISCTSEAASPATSAGGSASIFQMARCSPCRHTLVLP